MSPVNLKKTWRFAALLMPQTNWPTACDTVCETQRGASGVEQVAVGFSRSKAGASGVARWLETGQTETKPRALQGWSWWRCGLKTIKDGSFRGGAVVQSDLI